MRLYLQSKCDLHLHEINYIKNHIVTRVLLGPIQSSFRPILWTGSTDSLKRFDTSHSDIAIR